MQNDGWYRYEHASWTGGHGGLSGAGGGGGAVAIAATGGTEGPAGTSDASSTSDTVVTGTTRMRRGSSRTGEGWHPADSHPTSSPTHSFPFVRPRRPRRTSGWDRHGPSH